ncbi:MAG: NADPH-dependent F420 reductase [Candidatus Dormibacteria bacterium]
MRFAVLGTGIVGRTLAGALVRVGHEVIMGSRQAGNENAVAWAAAAGPNAGEGSFSDAASSAQMIVNATAGGASAEALTAAGESNLEGKVLIDVANPLDMSAGMPPTLSICNTESLGERLQKLFPGTRVVKTLNTVTADIMVRPDLVPGDHDLFLSGNDSAAKSEVRSILESFGWPARNLIDLGDISTSRGSEMYVTFWLRLMMARGNPYFNIHVVASP